MASCVHCGTSPERDETFSHCSRCKVMVYCSKTCQKQHWKSGHKDTCQASSESKDTAKQTANKTMKGDEKEQSKASGKKQPSCSSSGGAAAEEQHQDPARQVTARVDATGTTTVPSASTPCVTPFVCRRAVTGTARSVWRACDRRYQLRTCAPCAGSPCLQGLRSCSTRQSPSI